VETALEAGDPPMGVAMGRLFPFPDYYKLRKNFISILGGRLPQHSDLEVRFTGGAKLDGAPVWLEDYDMGEAFIEVTIFAIDYRIYAETFPEHHAAYYGKSGD
jgi:hypothetical protein